jgi:hypothetical protein
MKSRLGHLWYCQNAVAYPGILFVGVWTNSVEDRGQRERGSGGGSPLVRGSAQFANEWNPYSCWVVTDVFSMELGIRLSFVKTSEFGVVLNTAKTHTGKCCNSSEKTRSVTVITEPAFGWGERGPCPGRWLRGGAKKGGHRPATR